MRKRLNLRFIAYAFGALVVLVVGVHFLHAYQVGRNAGVLLTQADRAAKGGDLTRAVNHLNMYLGFKPQDAEVQARYGLLLADKKVAVSRRAKERALLALEKALLMLANKKQPTEEQHDLRRKVVRLAMDLERFTNAREDIEKYLLPHFPNDGELERLIAQCYDATSKYPDARKWYEKAVKHAPHDIYATHGLISLLRRHPDDVLGPKETREKLTEAADATADAFVKAADRAALNATAELDEVIDKTTNLFALDAVLDAADAAIIKADISAAAYVGRARYRREFAPSTDDEATRRAIANDVAEACKRSPDAADVLHAAAELQFEAKHYDAARQLLRHGIELHPRDWTLYDLLARTEVAAKQPDAALAAIRVGLLKQPKHAELLWKLAELTVDSGDKIGATDALKRLADEGFPPAALDVYRARLDIGDEKWFDAARRLEGSAGSLVVLATGEQGQRFYKQFALQGTLLLGRCNEQIGDADHALAAYNRALAQDPQSIPGRLGKAGILAVLGRTDDAIEQYRQVSRLPNAPAAPWIAVARLILRKQLVRPEKERDWGAVDDAVKQAEQLSPPPVEVAVLRADLLALQGQHEPARAHLVGRYADETTRPVAVWVALARLDQSQGRDGLAILAKAEQQVASRSAAAKADRERAARDRAELALNKVEILVARDKAGAVPALEAVAAAANSLPTYERRRLLTRVATAFQQVGAEAEAVRRWEQLAEEQPNDLNCRNILFYLAAQAGQGKDTAKNQQANVIDAKHMEEMKVIAGKCLKEMEAIEGPDGVFWRLARVSWLLNAAQKGDRAGLAEARTLLKAITARRPNWARAVFCEARLDELDKRTDTDLTNYLRAERLDDPDARQRAAELLLARGRGPEADVLYRKMPVLPPEARRLAAVSALHANDPSRAWDLAEKTVSPDSADYRDHLWLGKVAQAAGRLDRAEVAFVKSCELADDAPDAWVVWVQFLAATGKKDRATTACTEAERRFAGKSPLALAQCYEAVGQSKRAAENYQAAAATRGDAAALSAAADYLLKTGQTKDAIALLRRLVDECRASAPEAAVGGRCKLAVLLAAEGKTADASALLGDGKSVPEQRARARVNLARKDRASLQEALAMLESLIERHEADADDVHLAAVLYEDFKEWPKARSRNLQMIDMPGGAAPKYLAACAEALLRNGEAVAARSVVDRLESKQPAAFVTLRLKTHVLRLERKDQEAIALARKAAQHPDAGLKGAKLLEDVGDFASAEEAYRQAARPGQPPANVLILANFLIRQKRYGEAIDVCDRAWADCPPAAVSEVCLDALSRSPDPARLERVARRMEDVLHGKDLPDILTQLASVRTFQDRYDAAVALYRRALQLDPRQSTALNNLAWLLALRPGHGVEAVALADRAVATAPGDAGSKDTRALARLSLGSPEAIQFAVRELEELVTRTQDPTTYFHLACAYSQAGRKSEARRVLQAVKSRGFGPNDLHPLEQPAFDKLERDLQ